MLEYSNIQKINSDRVPVKIFLIFFGIYFRFAGLNSIHR